MGSAIVTVRKGLIAVIAADAAFDDVLVTLGFAVGKKDRERLWTQDARFTHAPASLRATKTFRDEEGMFNLRILVEGVGRDQDWTSSRAMTLGHVVEDLVATHSTWSNGALGVTVNDLQIRGDGALAEAFNDKGSLAELTYPVAYRARLT